MRSEIEDIRDECTDLKRMLAAAVEVDRQLNEENNWLKQKIAEIESEKVL